MSLKSIIKRQMLIKSGKISTKFTLPGEPLIYSLKYQVGFRIHAQNFFRNKQFYSILRVYYDAYFNPKTPVELKLTFFVSPPSYIDVKKADLKRENIPAVRSFEVCDYVLSYLEMLRQVLISSYRQIVTLHVEKYYSDNPRTVMDFKRWTQDGKSKNNVSDIAKAQGIVADRQVCKIQPKRKRTKGNSQVSGETTSG